jgi:hypothetical protein
MTILVDLESCVRFENKEYILWCILEFFEVADEATSLQLALDGGFQFLCRMVGSESQNIGVLVVIANLLELSEELGEIAEHEDLRMLLIYWEESDVAQPVVSTILGRIHVGNEMC